MLSGRDINGVNSNFKNNIDWKDFTLEEKVGQMIMIRVSGNFYNNPGYSYTNINNLISNYKIGGLIMYYGNIHGAFHNINLFNEGTIFLKFF